ncbi:MAG: YabP/YqfC family sporulation protein [Oscillospiraceae bacterium]
MKTKISDMLELPLATIFSETQIHLQKNCELLLEGYNTILEYGSSAIKISAHGFTVSISGENLTICFMDRNSLIIKGKIKAVAL